MGTNVYKMLNGERVELSEAESEQVVKDAAAIKVERDAYDAEAWVRSRVEEYGNIGDQLDEQFKDFDAWKTRIAAVKAKYPKPE